MNIFKALISLRGIGTSFTVFGELLKRIGNAILGPEMTLEDYTNPDRKDQSQDPSNSNGEEGEEPEDERQRQQVEQLDLYKSRLNE